MTTANKGVPLFGDRSAWNVNNHADLHASDLDASAPVRHVPLPGADGALIQSASGVWTRVAFDWDTIGAASGADMVHTHASAAEGGTLDWDNAWADAVHDHSASAEGGKLTQANTHESPDTDAATTSLHHTIGTGATQAAAGNHVHTEIVCYDDEVVCYDDEVVFS